MSYYSKSTEVCAYELIQSNNSDAEKEEDSHVEDENGMQIILRAFQRQNHDADVVFSILLLIQQMAKYPDVLAEMKFLGFDTHVVKQADTMFRHSTTFQAIIPQLSRVFERPTMVQ